MQKQFASNILKNRLFTKQDKLLVAVSGGLDSVVLAHLLAKESFNFSLAHCNYKLRGKDSDEDEKFCRVLAGKFNVFIHVKCFDLGNEKKTRKFNIQSEARKLRYAYFEEVMLENGYTHLLTAHHADDNVETVLMNLLRGSGIKGVRGIRMKNGKKIRPLLPFSKSELEAYTKEHKIDYRTDQSNFEDKYRRNLIRLKIVPLLREINPSLEKTFFNNSQRINGEVQLLQQVVKEKESEIVTTIKEETRISIDKLLKEKQALTLLAYFLSPFGFSETQQQNIFDNLQKKGNSGKLFYSENYQLTISRHDLVIVPAPKDGDEEIYIQNSDELNAHFKITRPEKFMVPKITELVVTEEMLRFPLVLRPYKTGDKFRPFGMKGFKLLSDFLKGEKLNAFEKRKCRVLVNGNGEIIWVVGLRSDDRYRVHPSQNNFLKLSSE